MTLQAPPERAHSGAQARPAKLAERMMAFVTKPMPTEKKAAGKPPFYSAYVNRRFGYLVAVALRSTGVTPNQLTAVCAILTTAGILAVALFRPTWPVAVSVTLLLLVGYVFDSADGQLSRLKKQGSILGEWLDHCFDCVKFVGLHLAVLVSLYRFFSVSRWLLLLPVASVLVSALTFFQMMLADQFRARWAGEAGPASPVPLWRKTAVAPTDYGVACFAFLLLPTGGIFLVVYGLLLAFSFLFLCNLEIRWYREMKAMDVLRREGS